MQKVWVRLAGLFVLLSLDHPAAAKDARLERFLADRLGTISSNAEPIFKQGVLMGCAVNFSTLVRDFTYKKGAFARIDGSFNMVSAKNNLGILLKIVVNDFDQRTYELTPNKPANAFFVFGNATSLPYLINQSIETDTPGAIVAVYDAVKTFPELFKSVSDGAFTVGFAREIGGLDIQVPLDLTIEDTDDNGNKKRSDKTTSGFSACALDFIKAEKERLNGK